MDIQKELGECYNLLAHTSMYLSEQQYGHARTGLNDALERIEKLHFWVKEDKAIEEDAKLLNCLSKAETDASASVSGLVGAATRQDSLNKLVDIMRWVDAYAHDYAKEGKFAKSRQQVEWSIVAELNKVPTQTTSPKQEASAEWPQLTSRMEYAAQDEFHILPPRLRRLWRRLQELSPKPWKPAQGAVQQQAQANQGHGHVTPRPDGVKARCGGPAICKVCQAELAAVGCTKKENTHGT